MKKSEQDGRADLDELLDDFPEFDRDDFPADLADWDELLDFDWNDFPEFDWDDFSSFPADLDDDWDEIQRELDECFQEWEA